jgi:hypothetical protein
MNGAAIGQRGRVRVSRLNVLFFTGFAENAPFNNAVELGMSVLTKPFAVPSRCADSRANCHAGRGKRILRLTFEYQY